LKYIVIIILTLFLFGCGSSENFNSDFALKLYIHDQFNNLVDNIQVTFINKTVVDYSNNLVLEETRPSTSFQFCTYDAGNVKLTILDIERSYVTTLIDERFPRAAM